MRKNIIFAAEKRFKNKRMEMTRQKRTREEVRAAYRETLRKKRESQEQARIELERIHRQVQLGMTLEEIFQ